MCWDRVPVLGQHHNQCSECVFRICLERKTDKYKYKSMKIMRVFFAVDQQSRHHNPIMIFGGRRISQVPQLTYKEWLGNLTGEGCAAHINLNISCNMNLKLASSRTVHFVLYTIYLLHNVLTTHQR